MARDHRGNILTGGTELPEGHLAHQAEAFDAAAAEQVVIDRSFETPLSDEAMRLVMHQALDMGDLATAQNLAAELEIRQFVNDTELL
jgi:hypothetical protein